MSFVVAVMTQRNIIMAADTQLNDDNGPVNLLGTKVFPFGNDTLVGITGVYNTYITVVNGIANNSNLCQSTFEEKVDYIREVLKKTDRDNNVIIAQLTRTGSQVTVMGNYVGHNVPVMTVTQGANVKTLLPPDVPEEYCRQFITSLDNLREQLIRCVIEVSKVSDTVNDKVCGFEIDSNGIQYFVRNIRYTDINIRLNINY